MQVLISDANILIDLEAGAILKALFALPMVFGIPDVLYWEEIEPGCPELAQQGLMIWEISPTYVDYALSLPLKYGTGPSTNDYLALALAKQRACPLLTGDRALREVAQAETVTVMGTVWLLRRMVRHSILSVDQSLEALERMRQCKRRLPWIEAERVLNALRAGAPSD